MAFSGTFQNFNRWLILRLAATLLCIASVCMLGSLLPAFDDTRFFGDGSSATFVSLPFAGNLWTILYNGIVLILFFCHRPYHPGVDIAMDFMGWGLNWAMAIMLIIWTTYAEFTEYECDPDYNGSAAFCSTARRIDGIQWMAAILTLAAGYVEFQVRTLFEGHIAHNPIEQDIASGLVCQSMCRYAPPPCF